jgi:bacillithiol biosynthesis cysteine-adding enzyme BshC
MAGNQLYLDYISGAGAAASFYSHPPQDIESALASRQRGHYPREALSEALQAYNDGLGAGDRALAHIRALRDPATFCVVTGQQAGFLGGPVYTAYKIVTAIRLARHLENGFGIRCVPVFWLASEDHDFGEINHAYLLKHDGEVGRVRFGWSQRGRPVAALALSDDIKRAYETYFDRCPAEPYLSSVRQQFSWRADEAYAAWQARLWSQIFGADGLIVIEPRILRATAPGFFRACLLQRDEIRQRLGEVSDRLENAGYVPSLAWEQAGQLYTFDGSGRRVRVVDPKAHATAAVEHPERYSTDAALRPIFADTVLPTVISVLGPGEIAYQAMLRPLYELFGLPQPLLVPRKSYTVLDAGQAARLAQYGTDVQSVIAEELVPDESLASLVPLSERSRFDNARQEMVRSLESLRPFLESVAPGLGTTLSQASDHAMRGLDKLEARTYRARLRQLGYSKGDLRSLRNLLLPRGRPQERVFPLPHFLSRYGPRFIDVLDEAGALCDLRHHILILEKGDV